MNNKIIAVIAAVILLLGAAGLYFLSQNKPTTKTSQTSAPTKAESKTSSLLELLTLGKSQRCTFTTVIEKGTAKGTVYVSKSNVRSDIITTIDNKESRVSMIRNGDDNYIWGSDMKEGIKMKISLEELSTSTQTKQYTSLNPEQKVDFNCSPWTPDSSIFTPPSTIKFTDMTALINSAKTTGTQSQTGSNPCSQITDASAKTACENALNNSNQ